MAYLLDLSKVTIEAYKDILRNQHLLPSRKILHQDIERSFDLISGLGINNLKELLSALSTPVKIEAFSTRLSLTVEYLTLLRREIGSIQPKEVALRDFPGSDDRIISSLINIGVKSSKDYYERYNEDKNSLLNATLLLQEEAEELYCLCGLVRINGVGALAAKCFYQAGYKTLYDIAYAEADDMLLRITEINNIKHYYQAKLGRKDMQFCIDFAKIVINLENAQG